MNVDLVLEGGGVKGIALVGAVSVLEERGFVPRRVAGSSAGAIVGSLVAAGMAVPAMKQVMDGLDYTKFKDQSWLDRLGWPGKGLSILFERGIYEGKYLETWLGERLAELGVSTFGDLTDDDDDPGSAADADPRKRFKLVVMASDVTQQRLAQLPWDYVDRYKLRDKADGGVNDRSVAESVRMSMAIPYFFEPKKLHHDRKVGTDWKAASSWMVDGGMLSNFPVHVFDRASGTPRWPTFGIKLSARPPDPESGADDPDLGNPIAYAEALLGTMTGFFDRMHIDDPNTTARTIFVDTSFVSSTDFGLSTADRKHLYENGRAAATAFLDGDGSPGSAWDLATYQARFTKP